MLDKFFYPKTIAVIGASNKKEKIGWQIINNLKKGQFKGKVFPVNLKEQIIEDLQVYKSVADIPSVIDLAVISIPSFGVLEEVKNCAKHNIKNIIIISAGFSEIGIEGKRMEREIIKIAQTNNINILGPNCLGLISSHASLNASFAACNIKKGNIAFISQSGAIGSAILDWTVDKDFSFSYFISLGNKAVLDENDFFEYLKNDNKTELVAAYLEEIKDGQAFMKSVSGLAKTKPVIILKSGQSQLGREAAMSHTGSLAGSEKAILTGLKRSGCIIIDNLEELFSLLTLLQVKTEYIGTNLSIVSNAGGPIVVTLDQLSKKNIALDKFNKKTFEKLTKTLPELVKIKNPLDILGDADASRYNKALDIILKDEDIRNILVLLTPQTSTQIEETARVLGQLNKKYKNKLITASFLGGHSLVNAKNILAENNIAHFNFPVQAIEALAKIVDYKKRRKELEEYKLIKQKKVIISQKRQLDYLESFKLLEKFNINVTGITRIENKDNFLFLDYPIVLKAVGPNLIHKTEQSSIYLNIQNKEQAIEAYKNLAVLLKNKENYCVAQEMITSGQELILGFKRDDSFGPIIMLGMGGIYTEIFNDISLEVDDVNYKRALKMIESLKVNAIISGARGRDKLNKQELAKAVVKIAKLARQHPEIKELDINPLFLDKSGVKAADIRIIV